MTAVATSPNSGLPAFLRRRRGGAKDSNVRRLMEELLRFFSEEEAEPEHADDEEVQAAGVAVKSPDGRLLFLRRSDKGDHAGEWAFPGGRLEEGEDDEQAARRELKEETGYEANHLQPVHASLELHAKGAADVNYQTFLHEAPDEFTPKLNDEHTEHRWASPTEPPEPLHPGVKALLSRDVLTTDPPVSEKQRRAMWAAVEGHSTLGIPKSVGEKFVGPHAHDDQATMDKADVSFEHPAKGQHCCKECDHFRAGDRCALVKGDVFAQDWCKEWVAATTLATDHNLDPLAWDKATVREFDRDGRLHVSTANISKAAVNPYLGREIPDPDGRHKLDPKRIYWMLRHPDELKRAAETFNGLPVVAKHVPTSAEDHPSEETIGSTGEGAEYVHPFLKNSLVIWPKKSIDGIEDQSQKELSCGYHYRADMTPGEYEGVRYDGVMRDIVGNHVALVKKGRAGPDVVVGDSAMESDDHATALTRSFTMPKTRLGAYIGGQLTSFFKTRPSRDALIALDAAVGNVTAADFEARRPIIKVALRNIRDVLAKDADLEGMEKHLDKVDAKDDPLEEDPNEKKEEKEERPHELEGMSDDAYGAVDAFFRKKYGHDETEEERREREEKEGRDKKRGANDNPPPFKGMPQTGGKMVTEDQMNSAIAVAVKDANKRAGEAAKAVRFAERAVEPWVGKLQVTYDTAEEVYRAALNSLGVRTDGVHESALPTMLQLVPKPGTRRQATPIALDSGVSADDFNTRFPAMKTARVI